MKPIGERGDFELLSGLLQGSRQARLLKASDALTRAGSLFGLRRFGSFEELGLSRLEDGRLRVALELGARALVPPLKPEAITTPEQACAFFLPLFLGAERERFFVVVLDAKHCPLSRWQVAEGSVDGCPVDVREVFRPALRHGGAGILVGHNHPSGDPKPSEPDLALTERLRAAGELLGMPLVDHIIVGAPNAANGRSEFLSFRQAGILRPRGRVGRR